MHHFLASTVSELINLNEPILAITQQVTCMQTSLIEQYNSAFSYYVWWNSGFAWMLQFASSSWTLLNATWNTTEEPH